MKTRPLNSIGAWLTGLSLALTLGVGASAQDAKPGPATAPGKGAGAQQEAGEPRVDTSSAAAPTAPAAAPSAGAARTTAEPTAGAAARGAVSGGSAAGATGGSGAATPPPRRSTVKAAATPAKGSKNAADRVDLDTTTITGNRELPKVLYIVPWKRSDIGDLSGRPVNSLLDEVLAPVDRDEFRREVGYYQALKPDTGASPPEAPH